MHYFVSGGRLLNFVGWTEHDTWNREDWTDRATIDRALAAFEGWHPQIRRIIARGRDLLHLGAVRPRPAAALVGRAHDAARRCLPPDVPVHGAGRRAGDRGRRRLAACLAAGRRRTRPRPCAATSELRLPRVTRLQEMSRANKRRYHMPDGPEQQARDAAMAATRERAPESMQWLFGFDAGIVPPP